MALSCELDLAEIEAAQRAIVLLLVERQILLNRIKRIERNLTDISKTYHLAVDLSERV
jgi:hypothetical protein